MNHEELKIQIGSNITACRKRLGMTQAELAQRLNYSDKAVSKWERSESVPDVLTLADIAQQFGIRINDLVYGPESEPEHTQPQSCAPSPADDARKTHNRKVIQNLVSILVWIVATAIYILADSFGASCGWLAYLFAIPAHAITLLSLRSAWGWFNWNPALISVIMWGSLAFLYAVIFVVWHIHLWRMLLLGILGQAAIIMWFKLLKKPKEDNYG